jgi:hypothetical protein
VSGPKRKMSRRSRDEGGRRTERNGGLMSQENVDTVRSPFRGVEERDLGAYIATGHPEVVIENRVRSRTAVNTVAWKA